jgi:DNA polymerase I-like protein with 3'-5' exonuclease and polymerase domains
MRNLHKLWLTRLDEKLYREWSDVTKVTIEMRRKGVLIDVAKTQELYDTLDSQIKQLEIDAQARGWFCNYESGKELAELLLNLGIALPITEKGNASCTKYVLDKINHPIADMIQKWRTLVKFRDDFAGMLLNTHINGRIHGEMQVLGARATGRFSHNNPNLANIPVRDENYGQLMRSLFISDPEKKWIHIDYSAQEPRLYVHYSVLCQKNKVRYQKQEYDRNTSKWDWSDKLITYNCPMIWDLQKEYINNPKLDSHEYNRDLVERTTGVSITRNQVKAIALGLAYGMGVKKLAVSLDIPYQEALEFWKAFNEAAPYIRDTSDYSIYLHHNRGYIKTLGGRKNHNDNANYRAYNYLIQGSAADQTMQALRKLYYELDIIPTIVVHDEINFCGTEEQAKHAQDIMQTAFVLEIPTIAEMGIGNNWAEAK